MLAESSTSGKYYTDNDSQGNLYFGDSGNNLIREMPVGNQFPATPVVPAGTGAWSATTTYAANAVVSYTDGLNYISLVGSNTGNAEHDSGGLGTGDGDAADPGSLRCVEPSRYRGRGILLARFRRLYGFGIDSGRPQPWVHDEFLLDSRRIGLHDQHVHPGIAYGLGIQAFRVLGEHFHDNQLCVVPGVDSRYYHQYSHARSSHMLATGGLIA
jgi:hypothetical protein